MAAPAEFTSTLEVPRDHPCYAGHFPEHPLVPGALLLAWLQSRVEAVLPDWQVVGVPSIKFLAEVRPGDQLTLIGRFNHERGRLQLQVSGKAGLACKASVALSARLDCA